MYPGKNYALLAGCGCAGFGGFATQSVDEAAPESGAKKDEESGMEDTGKRTCPVNADLVAIGSRSG
jgi:hypothetical protein